MDFDAAPYVVLSDGGLARHRVFRFTTNSNLQLVAYVYNNNEHGNNVISVSDLACDLEAILTFGGHIAGMLSCDGVKQNMRQMFPKDCSQIASELFVHVAHTREHVNDLANARFLLRPEYHEDFLYMNLPAVHDLLRLACHKQSRTKHFEQWFAIWYRTMIPIDIFSDTSPSNDFIVKLARTLTVPCFFFGHGPGFRATTRYVIYHTKDGNRATGLELTPQRDEPFLPSEFHLKSEEIIADIRTKAVARIGDTMSNLIESRRPCCGLAGTRLYQKLRLLAIDNFRFMWPTESISFAEACQRLDGFDFKDIYSRPCDVCNRDYNEIVQSLVHEVRGYFRGFDLSVPTDVSPASHFRLAGYQRAAVGVLECMRRTATVERLQDLLRGRAATEYVTHPDVLFSDLTELQAAIDQHARSTPSSDPVAMPTHDSPASGADDVEAPDTSNIALSNPVNESTAGTSRSDPGSRAIAAVRESWNAQPTATPSSAVYVESRPDAFEVPSSSAAVASLSQQTTANFPATSLTTVEFLHGDLAAINLDSMHYDLPAISNPSNNAKYAAAQLIHRMAVQLSDIATEFEVAGLAVENKTVFQGLSDCFFALSHHLANAAGCPYTEDVPGFEERLDLGIHAFITIPEALADTHDEATSALETVSERLATIAEQLADADAVPRATIVGVNRLSAAVATLSTLFLVDPMEPIH